MLSRTAENLFWITRYMERAETTARLMEVGYRIALMPSAGKGNKNDWESILAASGSLDLYRQKYGEPKQGKVETFMFFDRDNPSSVARCIETARDNGRVVRTALTSEVWFALNTAFQELRAIKSRQKAKVDIPTLCDWTKRSTALLRGAIESTQLQQDGYDFLNLGYYLERADNTARLLDVKYYVLLPVTDRVGGTRDNYQWTTLLRALSAYRAFHWAYGGDYTPGKIAHFLILNKACPRSLLHCAEETVRHLDRLALAYGKKTRAQELARAALARLAETEVDEIITAGLHEFLTRFIRANSELGGEVSQSYLFRAA